MSEGQYLGPAMADGPACCHLHMHVLEAQFISMDPNHDRVTGCPKPAQTHVLPAPKHTAIRSATRPHAPALTFSVGIKDSCVLNRKLTGQELSSSAH